MRQQSRQTALSVLSLSLSFNYLPPLSLWQEYAAHAQMSREMQEKEEETSESKGKSRAKSKRAYLSVLSVCCVQFHYI